MIRTIELPHVGESVTEGVIGKWLVEPGQRVEKYDPLVEVVTDKVSMEAPSPYAGVFVRALAEEGETVPMGQPICEMDVDGEEPSVVPAEAGTPQPGPAVSRDPLSLEGRGRPEGAGEGEPESQGEGADEASEEDDGGRVGGAWAMPAAHGADPAEAEHEFEFMDSVRSVGPTGSGEGGEGRRDALQEQAIAEHEHEDASPSVASPDRRHVISPLVARLSAQHGIDLSAVQGTGAGGRITSKDLLEAVNRMSALAAEESASPVIPAQAGNQGARAVHAGEVGQVEGLETVPDSEDAGHDSLPHVREGEGTVAEEAESEAEAAAPGAAAAADTSVLPLTPVRRIIAEHMARSAREIPAAWSMVETDVTRLVRTRDALKAAFEQQHGVPLTYLPFAAAAVAAALREHPRLNARWDHGHITLNNRVNLAVAVATDAGLMVPVLHDADTLSIAAIAVELRRLTEGARAGKLGIEDVQGGTFTLNNTGALGSVVSVPIINHPQAAILTTEAIVKRPVVVQGDAIAVRSMMNLCLTFDHRVCDGADAAAFLSAVKARLEVIDESIGLG